MILQIAAKTNSLLQLERAWNGDGKERTVFVMR